MSVEHTKPQKIEPFRSRFRFRDILIVVICIGGMIFFIRMFWNDLFQTIYLQNVQPVGTIIIKQNVVQRRISDRVLWDRLAVESPVYMGDIIRVADLSAATINIEGQFLELNENTLIRILRSAEDGSIQIELSEGKLGLVTTEDGGNLSLSVNGNIIDVTLGAALNVTSGIDGTILQVNDGNVLLTLESGLLRDIGSGSMIIIENDGTERNAPGAVVTHPLPNVRYLKTPGDSFFISFEWNRINLNASDMLRLEFAADRTFGRAAHIYENLNNSAQVSLNDGIWFWRLTLANTVLSTGRLDVIEKTGVSLFSPARNRIIRYQNDLPSLSFQWSEDEDASHYILEISDMQDFIILKTNTEVSATSFVQSNLGQGIWYWRVKPVYPSNIIGNPVYANSTFRILHGFDLDGAEIAEEEILEGQPGMIPLAENPLEDSAPIPAVITLVSPVQAARLDGLSVLRAPTVFRWESDKETTSSKFVLSRNADPLQYPAVEIENPGQSITINRIDEGVWYWTVEAEDIDGFVSSAQPRQLQVLAVSLLPVPANMRPIQGYRIDINRVRNQRNIVFTWSAVPGANFYTFSLFRISPTGRELINRVNTENRTTWTLDDIAALSRGTFAWQVEANFRNQAGNIEQRGRIGENTFVIDIPVPGVEANIPGILYGN